MSKGTTGLIGVLVTMVFVMFLFTVLTRINQLRQITNVGSIPNKLMVYDSEGMDNILTLIDWGEMSPGESKNQTCWVRNEGNYNLALSISVDNWTPENASQYLDLQWNRNDTTLESDTYTVATFTLSISSQVHDIVEFGFDIWVVGE